MKARYPGPKPFTSDEQALFFGREEDKQKLNQLVYNNRITVLFGRSGYGKSSLIQAGVVPYFSAETINYKVIQVRFTGAAGQTGANISLKAQLMNELKKFIDAEDIFLEGLIGNAPAGLWQVFKSIQWKIRETHKGILFIIDQFEEVFNFDYDYLEFFYELAELVHNRMPIAFQQRLMDRIESDENYLVTHKEPINFIDTEIPTSFLIGIRSDRIFLLDELGEMIPAIFNNRYSIGPLSLRSLDSIIRQPALAKGDFDCLPFTYSDKLIGNIRQYLSGEAANGKSRDTIEGFEFQIICQYIEQKMIDLQKSHPPPPGELSRADASLLSEGFNQIIGHYYISCINHLDTVDEFEKMITRFLIERKLIDIKTDNRICVDKTSILPLGFNNQLLNKVIATRLVRKELNTVSGESFELSHDTLVRAIRQPSTEKELGDLDDHIIRYYNTAVREYVKTNPLASAYLVEKALVDKQGNLVKLQKKDFAGRPNLLKNIETLRKYRIVSQENTNQQTSYVLNEVFQDVVIAKVNRSHLSVIRRFAFGFFSTLLLLGIIILLTVRALHISAKENALRIANLTAEREEDSVQSKQLLLLFKDLYNIIPEKDTISKAQIASKLVRQFNALILYRTASMPDTLSQAQYAVSSDDSIILVMGNQPLLNSGNSLNPPKTAVLYDLAGHFKAAFSNINYAALFNRHFVFVTKHDSLAIYSLARNGIRHFRPVPFDKKEVFDGIIKTITQSKDLPKIERMTLSDVLISEVVPYRFLDSVNVLASFRILCRIKVRAVNGRNDTIFMESARLLTTINLMTGQMIPLQTISMEELGISQAIVQNEFGINRQEETNFPKYYLADSGRRVAVLSNDGYMNHYLEYTDLRRGPAHPIRVPLPDGYFPLPTMSSVLYTDSILLCNYNADSFRRAPSIEQYTPVTPEVSQQYGLLKWPVSGKNGGKPVFRNDLVDITQNDDHSVSIRNTHGWEVLDEDLRTVYKDTLPKNSFVNKAILSPDRQQLLFNEDTVLLVVDLRQRKIRQVGLHAHVFDFQFSHTGDSIFCETYDNTHNIADGHRLHIMNHDLKELFACNNYARFNNNQIKGIFISGKDRHIYLMKLDNPLMQFDDTDPRVVADWIYKHFTPNQLPDSLRQRYHFVGGNVLDQFLSLFHDY